MTKKSKPGPAKLVADARAAGLSVTSRGVNLAALEAAAGRGVKLDGAVVNWQRLPEGYLETCREEEWHALVRSFAQSHGWECYHTRNSENSDEGFPDEVMVKLRVVAFATMIYVELKTESGVQSPAQKKWQRLIETAGGKYYLWRPSHWEEVQVILAR